MFLKRPKYLATNSALGEDVFKDAYKKIKKFYNGKKIDQIVLLMANAGTINSRLIKEGINILKKIKNMTLLLRHRFIICGAQLGLDL